jgi:hypothetical protein
MLRSVSIPLRTCFLKAEGVRLTELLNNYNFIK